MYLWDITLASVHLSFDGDKFESIVAAYESKFGQPPHRSYTDTVATTSGREYEYRIVEWDVISGQFAVKEVGSEITRGSASLFTPELSKFIKEMKAAEQQELADQL